MQLHALTPVNRIAKSLAPTFSRFVCSSIIYRPARAFDAYLNFLMGKGSGTGGDLNGEVNEAAKRIRRQQPVVFDVGANVGSWSKLLLARIPGARIHAFEPSPACQREIEKLILSGDAIVLVPAAVGEKIGRTEFHSSAETDGSASLYARGDSYFKDRQYAVTEVEVVTLDSFIDHENIQFVDFMKMDIEGHELFALRGAVNSL